jgi:CheY-like chemotaxis protein
MNIEKENKKILIAEDEKSILSALKLKLTHEGYIVTSAEDGEQALDELSKHEYDLFLCDLVMPDVHGFEVLETMNRKGIKTPVIILSNLSQEADETKAKALGAKDYLIKANTPLAEILDHIKKIVG